MSDTILKADNKRTTFHSPLFLTRTGTLETEIEFSLTLSHPFCSRNPKTRTTFQQRRCRDKTHFHPPPPPPPRCTPHPNITLPLLHFARSFMSQCYYINTAVIRVIRHSLLYIHLCLEPVTSELSP